MSRAYTDARLPDTQRGRSPNFCKRCGDLLILAHCRGVLDEPCDENGYGGAAHPCGEGSVQCCRCRAVEVEVLWQLRQDEVAPIEVA